MKLSKNKKYTIITIIYGLVFLLAYLYFREGNTIKQRSESELTFFIFFGVALYILAGIVIVIRAFYFKNRASIIDESFASTELNVLGQMNADKNKKINIEIGISEKEYQSLIMNGTYNFPIYFANKPLRYGDIVSLHTRSHKAHLIHTIVDKVDGVNRLVILRVINNDR